MKERRKGQSKNESEREQRFVSKQNVLMEADSSASEQANGINVPCCLSKNEVNCFVVLLFVVCRSTEKRGDVKGKNKRRMQSCRIFCQLRWKEKVLSTNWSQFLIEFEGIGLKSTECFNRVSPPPFLDNNRVHFYFISFG